MADQATMTDALAPIYPRMPIAARRIHSTMPSICDVCGKRRGGNNRKRANHDACAAIRKQRGFLPASSRAPKP